MEYAKRLFFFIILFLGLNIQALDCRLVEKFSDPSLANNSKFWHELGQLQEQSDEAVAALIKKHDPKFNFSSQASSASNTFSIPKSFNVSKASEKALKVLTPAQRRNFEDFVNTINGKGGVKDLYKNPGKWHFEKLSQYGGNSSIRLDQGMRVLFNADASGGVNIIDIGKHIGH